MASQGATLALDVSDDQPAAGAGGLTEKLRALSLAGGDLPTLAGLANGDSRTELTAALKALGFKGLRTRQELEQELRAWQSA